MSTEPTTQTEDPAWDFLNLDWSLSGPSPEPSSDTIALFLAARNGNFAENFADYEIASGAAPVLGADRQWLLALGADLGKALIGAEGHYGKAITGLQRIIRQLVKESGHGKPHHLPASYYLHWVNSIERELELRRDRISTRGRHAEIFGVFIGALEYMRAKGVKPTAPALFEFTRKLACANETDTRTAVEIHCRHVPLEAWLKPRRPPA